MSLRSLGLLTDPNYARSRLPPGFACAAVGASWQAAAAIVVFGAFLRFRLEPPGNGSRNSIPTIAGPSPSCRSCTGRGSLYGEVVALAGRFWRPWHERGLWMEHFTLGMVTAQLTLERFTT